MGLFAGIYVTPDCTENIQEIAIDFVGPFQNAIKSKKYLLVSVDPSRVDPHTQK